MTENEATEVVTEEPKQRRGRARAEAGETQEIATENPAENNSDNTLENSKVEQIISKSIEDEIEAAAEIAAESEIQEETEDTDDMFSKKGLTKASRTKRRKMYGGEYIIGSDEAGMEAVKTIEREHLREKDILTDALPIAGRNPKVLRGIIIGAEPATENYDPIALVKLILPDGKESHGFFTIKIPIKFLYDYDYNESEYHGEEGRERLYQEVKSRMNANIDFVPIAIDEPNEIVYASRLRAMSINGYYNYVYETRRTGKPLIQIGVKNKCKVWGDVIKVNRYGIVVDCKGAECFIKNGELNYNRIDNANEHFNVGAKVPVKILSLGFKKVRKNNEEFTLPVIEGSVRQAQDKKPVDLYYDQFNEGSTYAGVIKQKHDTAKGSKYWVTLMGKLDCICLRPPIGIPRVGQKCSVTINHKLEFPGDNGETVKQIQGNISRLYED